MFINKIITLKEYKIIEFLKKRNIHKQFISAKEKLLDWNNNWLDFKERQPKWSNIRSFRINKQYRARWYIEKKCFVLIDISDHQN